MASHTSALKRWALLLGSSIGILAALMAYLIWTDYRTANGLAPVRVDAQSILIKREGFDDIQLARINEQWQIQAPCRLTASAQRLSPLIAALAPGAHQYNTSDIDLDSAGLEQPLAVVFINDIEHRLGTTDLNGNRRYLQRGNAVELVPEWVLSLVNGGISAIAQLDVFPTPLKRLTISPTDNGSDTVIDNGTKLSQWQRVAAQQIVSWPLPDTQVEHLFQMQVEGSNGGNIRTLGVFKNERLIALVPDDSLCAYILAPDTLPTL